MIVKWLTVLGYMVAAGLMTWVALWLFQAFVVVLPAKLVLGIWILVAIAVAIYVIRRMGLERLP